MLVAFPAPPLTMKRITRTSASTISRRRRGVAGHGTIAGGAFTLDGLLASIGEDREWPDADAEGL